MTPKYDVSVVLPMANSSIFVFPNTTAPARSKFFTASAVYAGTKCSSILEPQVVRMPFVHRLSLTATGTPASGPCKLPSAMAFCTSSARAKACASSTVTKPWISGSFSRMAHSASVTASATDTSPAFIFLPSAAAVKRVRLIASPFYPIVLGTINPDSFLSGAFDSASLLPSPFVTTSSRKTLFTAKT